MILQGTTVTLEGAKTLGQTFLYLVEGLYSDEMGRAMAAGAAHVARIARANAPVAPAVTQAYFGKKKPFYGVGRTTQDPGRLRKAIISKIFKQAARDRYGPGAFAQVNLKKRAGLNTAPYGHIVESGRKAWVQPGKRGKGVFFFSTRGPVRTIQVGGFAGRFFFKRAVDASEFMVLTAITKQAQREIEKRYK